jgi:4-amino-4-deoxy-L-arabinose transferase-like glycosyltransferase
VEGDQATTGAGGRRGAAAFLLLALVVLANGAWQRDLFDADEGRYASVAWNMASQGDWVTPHLDGMPFMDKPPLVYWVQAVLFRLFGRHEILARAPTLLAGALWALFVWLFALRWTGSRFAAWAAGLLAVTSAAGIMGARVGPQMDMPLAASVAGVLWAADCGLRRRTRRSSAGLGLAVGAGLLAKGPLVVAVPLLVACAWMLAGVEPRRVGRVLRAPWAWAVALLVAAPWYVLVERANPGWIAHFITHEHFGRFSTGDHRAFNPFWFYVPITLVYLAPWTSLAWSGGWSAGRSPGGRLLALFTWSPWSPRPWDAALARTQALGRPGREVRVGRLAWGWFLAAFLLYSVATRKLLNYLLPAAAPLFVLLGAQLERRLARGLAPPWRLPLLLAGTFAAGGVLVTAGLYFPFRTGALPSAVEAPRWAPLGPWLVAAGALLAAGLLAGVRLRGWRLRLGALVLGAAAAWWAVDTGLARASAIGSSHALARALRAAREEADWMVCYKRYPQGLGFYGGPRLWIAGGTRERPWQREIVPRYARPYWFDEADLEARARRGAPRPPVGLLDDATWQRIWRGAPGARPQRVVAVVRWAEIAPLDAYVLSGPYAGAGRTDLYVVTNRPQGS